MSDSRRTPWAEYWTTDPYALHAERPDTTVILNDETGRPTGLTLDSIWYDTNDKWIATPTRDMRIGNPHWITADAHPNDETGAWALDAWSFRLPSHDDGITDLTRFAIRHETPHASGIVTPAPPKRAQVDRSDMLYPQGVPTGRTLEMLTRAMDTAAIRVAYALITETHPNIIISRVAYGRSVTGLLDGKRFIVRFKGQRASLMLIPENRKTPYDLFEVRMPGPYPFLTQLDGSPAERLTEAMRMLLLERTSRA